MKKLFSGKNSDALWKKINKVKTTNNFHVTWESLYALACKCQELENAMMNKSNRQNKPQSHHSDCKGIVLEPHKAVLDF